MNKLANYNDKRDFSKTTEPKGKETKSSKNRRFVVQHHYARKEHYDLRLEYDGVYKSFAVPKGPSFDPKDKRLAVQVEDHPLNYGNFEGVIPKGEYGGGVVQLWDKGNWQPLKTKPDFKDGPIKFILKGTRLKGAWALIKMEGDNWLLIKEQDEFVDKINISKYKTSIKTGRTVKEIEKNIIKPTEIEITSPEKVIIKTGKITKQDIFDYYCLVNERIMPFLENRLISTVRCPSGVKDEKFFMKHLNTKSKDIGKKLIKDKDGKSKDYYYLKNINGLLSEVQMNSYEFHIWGSLRNSVSHPDILVFDLDPDKKLELKKVREAVKELKKILDNFQLKSYLKTSGGKGYHILVPLKMRSFKEAFNISHKVAELMVERNPNKYTINMRMEARKGRIFIDFFRNQKGATSVAPYSLRLRDNGPISFPISWRSLEKIGPSDITIKNVKDYLKRKDPWEDFFDLN